mmetsp:Transcript_45899/g.115576  ORF Transcript_45899/g.115576 Transcript_45899/m.115576 type:complete len:535 (+) Transcript_45899:293-1897(+)
MGTNMKSSLEEMLTNLPMGNFQELFEGIQQQLTASGQIPLPETQFQPSFGGPFSTDDLNHFSSSTDNGVSSPPDGMKHMRGGHGTTKQERKRDAAREYRKRKKVYMEEMQQRVDELLVENQSLRDQLAAAQKALQNAKAASPQPGQRAAKSRRTDLRSTSTNIPLPDAKAAAEAQDLPDEKADPSSQEASKNQLIKEIRDLQSGWTQDVEVLEREFEKGEDVEAQVAEMQKKSLRLYALYKKLHLVSLDFTVFANFAFFGYSMYCFDQYADSPTYPPKDTNPCNDSDLGEVGPKRIVDGQLASHARHIEGHPVLAIENIKKEEAPRRSPRVAKKGAPAASSDIEAMSVQSCCDLQMMALPMDSADFDQDMARQLQQSGFLPTWHELTKGMSIPLEKKLTVFRTICGLQQDILALKKEHREINKQLIYLLRRGMPLDAHFQDANRLMMVTAKLSELRNNYDRHWAAWEKGLENINSSFTPHQRAQILLRRKSYLERVGVLNSLWATMNGFPMKVASSHYPFSPLPIHLTWSFLCL